MFDVLQDVAGLLQAFKATDILVGVISRSRCPRLTVSFCLTTGEYMCCEIYGFGILDVFSIPVGNLCGNPWKHRLFS